MNRSELVKTLELVKPALATTNMVPVFQCFIFSSGTVSAYDDTVAIVGPSEVENEFAVHGNTLLGLLANSKSEDVEFKLAGNEVTFSLGKTVSRLPYQPKDNFIFTPPKGKWDFTIPFTESFATAIKICMGTVSSDATQAALLGISIDTNCLYSCNGDALTRIKIKQGIKGRVLLPSPFCSAVLKLWSSLSVTKGTLNISDDWVFADLGEWSVYGRVLEVAEPIDFEALIKQNVKTKIETVEMPDGFGDALSRAMVLSEPESQKTVLTVSGTKLSLSTETHMGEVKDVVHLKAHTPVVANINASLVSKAIGTCDRIAFLENCTLLERAPDVLMIVSNMG